MSARALRWGALFSSVLWAWGVIGYIVIRGVTR